MKILYLFSIFSLSLIVMLAISPLRGYPFGMGYSSLAGFIIFFLFSLITLKKFSSKMPSLQILFAVILGLWIIQLPIRIIDFEGTIGSLPDVLIHTLGILCGFLYWYLKKPLNALTAFLGCIFSVFMFFQGYDLWFHKLNHGTFTGRVEAYNLPTRFEAIDEKKNFITGDYFNDKIVLLDFWTTTCGICFQKFPQLQTEFEKYKNDSSVEILAVNAPNQEDKPNQAFQMIKERNYTFPVVTTKDANLPEKFGVKGYPKTFVINRNGQIVYRGGIEGAIKMVDELKSNSR